MNEGITEEMRNPQTLNLRQCEGSWVKMETYKLLLAQFDFLKSKYDESAQNVIGALESENARLNSEVDRLRSVALSNKSAAEAERFAYQNAKINMERLSQAGDALDDAVQTYFELLPTLINEVRAKAFLKGRKASREWNATKEGIKL